MWETVILHDFIQEERKQQFNNQVKGKNGNKMIIIRAKGTPNSKQKQGHQMVTSSQAEAPQYHQIMK